MINKNKLMTAFMAGTMLIGSAMPVFATEFNDLSNNYVGSSTTPVTYDSSKTPDFDQTSLYKVRIPKAIDLGANKSVEYSVGVAGHIADKEHIVVKPDATFVMTKEGATDTFDAKVTQENTTWNSTEVNATSTANETTNEEGQKVINYTISSYAEHNGTISVAGIGDGKWSGTLTFTIGRTVD